MALVDYLNLTVSPLSLLLAGFQPTGQLLDSLQEEANGFILDPVNGKILARDTTTAANNKFIDITPQDEADAPYTFAGGPKLLRQSDGSFRYQAMNLFVNSESPATQNITVLSGQSYTVTVTGSGSVALSGAGTGTATDGSPVAITASTATLTCTVSGSPNRVHVRITNADTTYLETGASARYGLPVANGVLKLELAKTNLCTNTGWSDTGCDTTEFDVSGPDGLANSAHRVVIDSSSGYHYTTLFDLFSSDGLVRTWQVAVKRTAGRYITVGHFFRPASVGASLLFDQQTGQYVDTDSVTSQIDTVFDPIALPDDYWLLGLSSDQNHAFYDSLHIGFFGGDTYSGNEQFTGNGTDEIHFFAPTVTEGGEASSLIPTFGSQVDRVEDNFEQPISTIPFGAEHYILIDSDVVNISGQEQVLYELDGGSGARTKLAIDSSGDLVLTADDTVSITVDSAHAPFTKVGVSFATNDVHLAVNGTIRGTDTSATINASRNDFHVGQDNAGVGATNMTIRSLKVLDRKVSQSENEADTA